MRLAGVVGAVAIGGGLLGWSADSLLTPHPSAPHVVRFAMTLPPGEQFFDNLADHQQVVALSPDSAHLAYVANQRLMLRAMDQLEATPIRGSEAERSPFFSPDGQWIGFWQNNQLRKVSVNGGAPVRLCDAANPWGASWDANDTILYGQGPRGSGACPDKAARPSGSSRSMSRSVSSPTARRCCPAATSCCSPWRAPPETMHGLSCSRWRVGSGRCWSRAAAAGTSHPGTWSTLEGTLFAAPFDAGQLEVKDRSVPLLEGVAVSELEGIGHFSLSTAGTLVYVPRTEAGRTLVWVDRHGHEEAVPTPPRPYFWVRVSPDGTRLAMEVQDQGNSDVWIYDLARNTPTRLTFALEADRCPIWTPDGQRVVFRSGSDIAWTAANATAAVHRLATGLNAPRPYTWAGDGKGLIFDQAGGNSDLLMLPLEGERKLERVIANEHDTTRPAVSPDGRWIAYRSTESSPGQIYVQSFPNVSVDRLQISTSGEWLPSGPGTAGNSSMTMATP